MSERGNEMRRPHSHAAAAGSPGASGPGEPGFDGDAMVGDEGAAAGPESFDDPLGRSDSEGAGDEGLTDAAEEVGLDRDATAAWRHDEGL
jgi:hypothetical protein